MLKGEGKREGEGWSTGGWKAGVHLDTQGAWCSQLPLVSPAETPPLQGESLPRQSLASPLCPVPPVHADIPCVCKAHAITALRFKKYELGKVCKRSRIFIRPAKVARKTTTQKDFETHGALKNNLLARKLPAFFQPHQLI